MNSFGTEEKPPIERLVDGVLAQITKPRKIRTVTVQRAGSHYKARYAGGRDCCFGVTPKDAAARLKTFEK